MFFKNTNFSYLLLVLSWCVLKCDSTGLVPVYLWETQNEAPLSPALQKISESSFKDILMKKIEKNPLVVIFAEESLSPEDFAQHDENGATLFPSLRKFIQTANVAYQPYVENPLGAIKQLGKGVTELSVASLERNFNIPKDEVLIVNLHDAKDDEQRNHMLKRHDAVISKIHDKLLEINDNILAMYTAHHPSWVEPDEVRHRNVRSLLQEANNASEHSNDTEPSIEEKTTSLEDAEPQGLISDSYVLLYVSSTPLISYDNKTFKPLNLQTTSSNLKGNLITLVLSDSAEKIDLTMDIVFEIGGYWKIANVTTNSGKTLFTMPTVTAAVGFSYHCGNVTLLSQKMQIRLPGFQIEPFRNDKMHSFGDPYDCVGFTSIPIWSGIFVSAILLLILTFGLTLIMDIKTMDKFDDAKGKTITINVAE